MIVLKNSAVISVLRATIRIMALREELIFVSACAYCIYLLKV